MAEQLKLAQFESLISVTVPVIFGLIFVLGFTGNLLVILTVIRNRHMRNSTNILIFSLAIADILFIIFCIPSTATTYALPTWPFGNVWCKILQYIIYVSAYASVYTLVLLAVDRCFSFRNLTYTWIAVLITWGVILSTNVIIFFQYGEFVYLHRHENRSACLNIADLMDPSVGQTFFACFFAFGYVVPLGIICVVYSMMLLKVFRVSRENHSAEITQMKKRVTRMVAVVIAAFAVCWLPIQVILVIQKFGAYPQEIPFVVLHMAANCLAYMNSCINPFLYAFLSENFRRNFLKMIGCASETRARSTNNRNDNETKVTNF